MSTKAHERIPAFTVGDRLRRARQKTGLDQAEFGAEIGVSRGTVSNYESADDATVLKKPYLLAWALRADVPLEWLLTGDAPATPPPSGGGEALAKLTEAKRSRAATRRGTGPTVGYVTGRDQAA